MISEILFCVFPRFLKQKMISSVTKQWLPPQYPRQNEMYLLSPELSNYLGGVRELKNRPRVQKIAQPQRKIFLSVSDWHRQTYIQHIIRISGSKTPQPSIDPKKDPAAATPVAQLDEALKRRWYEPNNKTPKTKF